MKCPVLTHDEEFIPNGIKYTPKDCLKGECSWYQKDLENCIVYQAGMELGVLLTFIEDLVNKMPHENQFRK